MIVTRFAPSPTGRLHLGHAFSAVLGHAEAMKGGGRFLLRIEDLDQGRSRPEFVDGIYRGPALARPRMGRAGAGPVEADAGLFRRAGQRYATRGWSTPASAPARTSRSRSLLRTATRPRHIPGPADRLPTIRIVAPRRRIAGGWIPQKRSEPEGCPLDGDRWSALRYARRADRRRHPRAEGCARQLPSVLRRGRCRQRRDHGRSRRRPPTLHPDPEVAAGPAWPAGAHLSASPARHA